MRITMVCQVVKIIAGFASRTVFTWLLGVQYLGVQGLFSNILSLLSFVELGMGSAIVFNLYDPLKRGDKKRICQYLQFYKKLYHVIIAIIAVLGLLIVPFLDNLVKAPDIRENITIIYLLFLLQTCLSYAFVYKKNLLIADQKTYLTAVYQQISVIVINIIQIIVLCLYTNYYLFLVLGLSAQLLENYICVRKANELYPYIKDNVVEKLPLKDIRDFKRNVKGLFVNKIAGVTFDSTDNIFISTFLGISSVGILSNYLLITATINAFLNQIVGSIGATVGNLALEKQESHEYQMFRNIYFANTVMYGCLTCILAGILGAFITDVWLDDEFYLPHYIILLIILEWCLRGMHYPVFMFRSAHGFFYQLKMVPLWAAVGNLVMDYFFVQWWGLAGIYLATIAARMTVRLADVYTLYNVGFKRSIWDFYRMHFFHLTLFSLVILIEGQIVNRLNDCWLIHLSITLLSLFLYLLTVLIFFRKTAEVKFIKENILTRMNIV